MRVALAFDAAAERKHADPDIRGVLEAVHAIAKAALELGHTTHRLPVDAHDAWRDGLEADVVFNLCEGVNGDAEREVDFAVALEQLGVAFTGNRAYTLALARRKDRMNRVLEEAGLGVPAWTVIDNDTGIPDWHHFPAIVKPAGEDASVGITQQSVAHDAASLREAVDAARAYGPLLVQRFVQGRELNVAFLGDTALPLSEIEFAGLPAGFWPIVSYTAKWEARSIEDAGTIPRCPAHVDAPLEARVTNAARRAWDLVEGRGYGRVDVRVDGAGDVHIIDVNPNPDLAPGAGFARMASAHVPDYTGLVDRILLEALA